MYAGLSNLFFLSFFPQILNVNPYPSFVRLNMGVVFDDMLINKCIYNEKRKMFYIWCPKVIPNVWTWTSVNCRLFFPPCLFFVGFAAYDQSPMSEHASEGSLFFWAHTSELYVNPTFYQKNYSTKYRIIHNVSNPYDLIPILQGNQMVKHTSYHSCAHLLNCITNDWGISTQIPFQSCT